MIGDKLGKLVDAAKDIKELCDDAKHAKKLSGELDGRINHCVSMIEFFDEFIKKEHDSRRLTMRNIASLQSVADSLLNHMQEAKEELTKYSKMRGIWKYQQYTKGKDLKEDMKETLDKLVADILVLGAVVQMWEQSKAGDKSAAGDEAPKTRESRSSRSSKGTMSKKKHLM